MITISLCMIVKNEEEVLGRCLDSVGGIADEMIIVDTGSDDNTKAIALSRGARVFDFAWRDDFSAARNFSFSHAGMDYILWLDADDVLLPDDRARLLALKQEADGSADTIMMPYHTAFDEEGKPTFFCERERILRRDARAHWQEPVHEVITPFGSIVHWHAAVTHKKEKNGDPGRNLTIYENALRTGKTLSPRASYYYARELFSAGQIAKAEDALLSFLRGGGGWAPDCVEACILLSQCRHDRREALLALLEGLTYAVPAPRLCCMLGSCFLEENLLPQAVYWLEQALTAAPDEGFQYPDYRDYIPHLQLCVCYDRLGDLGSARRHNEKAAVAKPQSEQVAHNRAYLAGRGFPA